MNNNYKTLLLFIALSAVYSCSEKGQSYIVAHYDNPAIAYSGRLDTSRDKGAELRWSGSSIKFNFEGEAIEAIMDDEQGDNYYNVIIDDGSPFIFRPDTSKQSSWLAKDLAKGKHSIEIFKRTEWDRGASSFYGFKVSGTHSAILPRQAVPRRAIEFYGNSITAGYAIEDFSGKDSPDSTFTNSYLSYAAITARHFEADYHFICKSGIGVTVSWFPQIMPEIYNRVNPNDPKSQWDFAKYRPDIVVVNLLQNDSWLVGLPEHEEFKRCFGTTAPDSTDIIAAYQKFIAQLRGHYPTADIICTLGSMDAAKEGSVWMDYVETAVAQLVDPKIHTHFMPYIEATTHPTIEHHEVMAKHLISFIDQNIEW